MNEGLKTPQEIAEYERWLHEVDDFDEDDPEYNPDCPACLRNLPHTQAQHEQHLARAYAASKGDW